MEEPYEKTAPQSQDGFFFHSLTHFHRVLDQCDNPRESDEVIHKSHERRPGTKKPHDEVEVPETNETPIETADDEQYRYEMLQHVHRKEGGKDFL